MSTHGPGESDGGFVVGEGGRDLEEELGRHGRRAGGAELAESCNEGVADLCIGLGGEPFEESIADEFPGQLAEAAGGEEAGVGAWSAERTAERAWAMLVVAGQALVRAGGSSRKGW